VRTPISRRLIALSLLLLLAPALVPSAVAAQGGEPVAQIAADAYQRDAEVVFINRNDGKIVIRDYAVGANMKDLNGKYDSWGGNWYDLAAGDFNGDGNKEIVVIGGTSPTAEGPQLKVFDPVQGTSSTAQYSVDVSPYKWQLVRTGDLDGDGRAEIVGLRSTSEAGGVTARLVAYEYEAGAWREKWNLATGGGFYDIDLGDYDADGKADIAACRIYSYVIVLDGENPTISHFEAKISNLADWRRIRIGDVTGDNSADLTLLRPQQSVSGNWPAAVLVIHPKTGNAYDDVFGWGLGNPPEDIELADMNSDGKLEVVAVNTGDLAKIYTFNPRLADSNNNRTEEEVWIGDREWADNLVLGDANGNNKPERALMRKTTGAFARILAFEDNGAAKDESTNAPYADNFVISNLDSTGILVAARMVVPAEVHFYYDLSTGVARQTTIQVANAGGSSFTWTATPQGVCNWLTLDPASGNSNGTITFTLVPAGLTATDGWTAQCQVAVLATGVGGVGVTDPNQTVTVGVSVVDVLYSLWVPLARR